MSLSLPADLEPYTSDHDDLHNPAVYSLRLGKPKNLPEAWDAEYERRPPYFAELQDAATVFYVGATGDALSRLEDHRDGEVRTTALTRVCSIEGLHTAWLYEDADEAFLRESQMARWLQESRPDAYVHQR